MKFNFITYNNVLNLKDERMSFDRWGSRKNNSWALTVFKKHYTEVIKMHNSYKIVPKYVYKDLGKVKKAQWADLTSKHFGEISKNSINEELFINLKEWSRYFNIFSTWSKYSSILALSGNFEVYIDKIITIAIESDVGLLINFTQSIDGIKLKKTNNFLNNALIEQHVLGCVKGTWYQRVDNIEKIFNWKPELLCDEKNIKLLENIRKKRNDAAHAYGRNIKKSKNAYGLEFTELTDISEEVVMNYFILIYKLAKQIDKYLLNKHIGEFQCLNFYHELRHSNTIRLINTSPQQIGYASEVLRKKFGKYSNTSMGKKYYRGLVDYYEKL
jgi:hypothetical protein